MPTGLEIPKPETNRGRSLPLTLVVAVTLTGTLFHPAWAECFQADVKPLLDTSCLICHGEGTVPPLNLTRIGYDLSDPETYRTWERVFERVGKVSSADQKKLDAYSAVRTAEQELRLYDG